MELMLPFGLITMKDFLWNGTSAEWAVAKLSEEVEVCASDNEPHPFHSNNGL